MASAAPAAIAARARRRIAAQLRAGGALDPGRAIPLHPDGFIARHQLARLVRDGSVGDAGDGLHWLDEAAFAASQARRRTRVLGVLGVGLGAVALAALLG